MSILLERLLFPPARLDPAALRRRHEGRTVLVTGASFGIGEQVARIVGKAGARVLLVSRTATRSATCSCTGGQAT